jgi:hypothetical protein
MKKGAPKVDAPFLSSLARGYMIGCGVLSSSSSKP